MPSQDFYVSALTPWIFIMGLEIGKVYQIEADPGFKWNTNPAYPPCTAAGNGNHTTWDYCISGAIEGQLVGALQNAPAARPDNRFLVNMGTTLGPLAENIGLYLSINDDYRAFGDNSGQMKVTINW
jgi:hypothetical protein